MKKLYGLLVFIFLFSVMNSQTLYNYPDQLNYSHFPSGYNDSISTSFSAGGAWFGIGLPGADEPDRWGKIAGPYSNYTNDWIGRSLLQFNFGIAGFGKIQFESAIDFEIVQYPGLLYQKYTFDSYIIEENLIFISGRTCLMKVDAINTSERAIPMSLMIKGAAYEDMGEAEQFTDGWMYKIDGKDDVFFLIRFRVDNEMNLTFNPDSYEFSYKEPKVVLPGDTLSVVATMSQYFKGDSKKDVMAASEALNFPDRYFERNEKMWSFLISNVVPEDVDLRKVSVKSLQTLFLNLRSNIPSIRNYFFVERSGEEETEINTDESWLYASSLIRYDTKLAINALASNLSNTNLDSSLNQIIPILNNTDSVFVLNERPMAAWTAWNIFAVNSDVDLMAAAYPILQGYHNYWYEYQDANKNMWCEDSKGVERPDVNALLFSEKYCLMKIAETIGRDEDVIMYKQQMDSIKLNYTQYFFDIEMISFVSYDLTDDSKIPASEAIAFALWSGLASFDVADYYAEIIQNNITNGYFDEIFKSGRFDISYYYFLISGLKLYKHEEQSAAINEMLISQVLEDSKNKPLPSYGYKGMVNDNSSLTAAVLLLLINY